MVYLCILLFINQTCWNVIKNSIKIIVLYLKEVLLNPNNENDIILVSNCTEFHCGHDKHFLPKNANLTNAFESAPWHLTTHHMTPDNSQLHPTTRRRIRRRSKTGSQRDWQRTMISDRWQGMTASHDRRRRVMLDKWHRYIADWYVWIDDAAFRRWS